MEHPKDRVNVLVDPFNQDTNFIQVYRVTISTVNVMLTTCLLQTEP